MGIQMIIDHVGFSVSDYVKSKQFYTTILAPIGIKPIIEKEEWVGFGKQGKPEFWFGQGHGINHFIHIAFLVETRDTVNAFYQVAIGAGAVSSAKPGFRTDYYPGYYGAFVTDYDGHHIGAVVHET